MPPISTHGRPDGRPCGHALIRAIKAICAGMITEKRPAQSDYALAGPP